MFTPWVIGRVATRPQPPPERMCVIWRRVHGEWDFFKRVPADEVEVIVRCDAAVHGFDMAHYKVMVG